MCALLFHFYKIGTQQCTKFQHTKLQYVNSGLCVNHRKSQDYRNVNRKAPTCVVFLHVSGSEYRADRVVCSRKFLENNFLGCLLYGQREHLLLGSKKTEGIKKGKGRCHKNLL